MSETHLMMIAQELAAINGTLRRSADALEDILAAIHRAEKEKEAFRAQKQEESP